jgi:hypothetical protein
LSEIHRPIGPGDQNPLPKPVYWDNHLLGGAMTPQENDDPWTYFGSFSRAEVDGAAALLTAARIVFEIKDGPDPTREPDWKPGGWTGPFALWVRDESAAKASDLLVPYFASREPRSA